MTSSHIVSRKTLRKSVDFQSAALFQRCFRDPSRPNTWLAQKCVIIIHICINNEIKALCSAAKSVTSHALVFDMDHQEVLQRVLTRRVSLLPAVVLIQHSLHAPRSKLLLWWRLLWQQTPRPSVFQTPIHKLEQTCICVPAALGCFTLQLKAMLFN